MRRFFRYLYRCFFVWRIKRQLQKLIETEGVENFQAGLLQLGFQLDKAESSVTEAVYRHPCGATFRILVSKRDSHGSPSSL